MTEMNEPRPRAALIARVADELLLRAASLGHPLRAGIDGRSTAGKSHLAEELVDELRRRGREAMRVSIDEFHRPGHKFRSERGEWTPESRLAEGLDYAAFRSWVLEPLGPGGSRRIRPRMLESYHDRPWPEEWFELGPDAVLISDAGHGFVPQLLGHWDYRIWLEVSAATMIERATSRDIAWAGTREQVRRRYEDFWVATDALYQLHHDPAGQAHCLIDNNDLANPLLLRSSSGHDGDRGVASITASPRELTHEAHRHPYERR